MLTPRQKEILNYTKSCIKKNDYSPSLEEIGKHFKLSVSTVHQHIEALKDKGFLNKTDNQARSIEVFTSELMVQVPFFGTIAAGQPIEVMEERETIAIPKSKLPSNGSCYALKVRGDSMVDENINDGDIVLVRHQETAKNGQRVIALIDNREATLKKFYKEKGIVRLQPANKNMEPIVIGRDRDIKIQGVLIDVIQSNENTIHNIPVSKKIEYYHELPINQIMCGDAINIMEQLPECSIDLTVTSPPYDELRNYKGYNFNFEGIARGLYRITKEGGVVVWVVGDKIKKGNKSLTSFKQALYFQQIGFNVHDIMIYRKKNTPFMRSNAYTNCFEFMFVLSKNSPKTFTPLRVKTVRQGQEKLPHNKGADGINKKILAELKPEKTKTNIWDYAVGYGGSTIDKIAFEHPAIYPEKLAEDHILSWTKIGDVVFDPMCGSGTTCKMALKNARAYIGCDISKDYVDLANKRLATTNI